MGNIIFTFKENDIQNIVSNYLQKKYWIGINRICLNFREIITNYLVRRVNLGYYNKEFIEIFHLALDEVISFNGTSRFFADFTSINIVNFFSYYVVDKKIFEKDYRNIFRTCGFVNNILVKNENILEDELLRKLKNKFEVYSDIEIFEYFLQLVRYFKRKAPYNSNFNDNPRLLFKAAYNNIYKLYGNELNYIVKKLSEDELFYEFVIYERIIKSNLCIKDEFFKIETLKELLEEFENMQK